MNLIRTVSRLACIATLLSGLHPASAQGSTATTTIAISATVQATCTVSAVALAFGTYTGTALAGTTTISVQCTNTTPYNVGIDQGGGTGATVTTRIMTNGGATLSYSLYTNVTHTSVWGNTIGTNTVTGTGNGAVQALTVYGLVNGTQFPTPGSYTDTVNVTVTY